MNQNFSLRVDLIENFRIFGSGADVNIGEKCKKKNHHQRASSVHLPLTIVNIPAQLSALFKLM